MAKPIQAHQSLQGRPARASLPALRAVPNRRAPRQSAVRRVGARRVQDDARRVLPLGARGDRAAQRRGDHEGCRLENGAVLAPRGFKEAWKSLYEAGWKQLAVEARVGRRRRAARVASARRGDDQRLEHRVRDVLGPRLRRRRSHRSVRHRRAEEALLPAHVRRPVGRHDVPDRAAGGQRRRQREHDRHAQRRRQLLDPRNQDFHLRQATTTSPRTSSTSCWRASNGAPQAPRA